MKSRQVPFFLYWPVENVQFFINSIGHIGWLCGISNFARFHKNVNSLELWKHISENSSPKGSFWRNIRKSEFSDLSSDSPYLLAMALKTEFTRSSSNNWAKTLYQDYLHRIANFTTTVLNMLSKKIISSNTKRRKQMLSFAWTTWKYWWNETDDEILPVFAQFLRTLKFVFPRSQGKLFSVLFQATIYIFSFKKMQKGL